MALSYAVSPRGACHLRSTLYKAELSGSLAGLSAEEEVATLIDWEDRLLLADCLIICRFYRDFLSWDRLAVLVSELAGRPLAQSELRELCRDSLTRIRRLNFAMGLGPEHDSLAPRFFTEGTDTAPPLDREAFQARLRLYWEGRGWGREGWPAPA
jgi:aldehyde:ferredoxin oxidoreductase